MAVKDHDEDYERTYGDAGRAKINESAVKGERGTGFEKGGNKGPFECGNCSHMQAGTCHQPDMVREDRLLARDAKGYPKVDEDDCCEYVDRIGKKK